MMDGLAPPCLQECDELRVGWPQASSLYHPLTTIPLPTPLTSTPRLEEASSGFLESLVFLEGRIRRINSTSQ